MKGSIVQLKEGESKVSNQMFNEVQMHSKAIRCASEGSRLKLQSVPICELIDVCNYSHPHHLSGLQRHQSFSQVSINLKSKVSRNLLVSHHFADKGL